MARSRSTLHLYAANRYRERFAIHTNEDSSRAMRAPATRRLVMPSSV